MSLHGPTWQEATAGSLWLIGAAGLAWLGPQLPLLESVILWTVLLVGLLIVLQRVWSWFLGPLFIYDLVRIARRNRLIPPRSIFAIALLAVVFFFYVNRFGLRGDSWDDLFSAPSVRRDDLASFGSSMFSLFFGMQYLAVFLLTPLYTAGAIAEEKERGTLDLLLTTPLKNREIVIGLLASRLATIGITFLTILPVLSLMEFLGGVDPGMVLAGFLITALAMVCLANLCMAVSLYAKNWIRAMVAGYFFCFLLCAFWIWVWTESTMASFRGHLFDVGKLIGAFSILLFSEILLVPVLHLRKVVKGSGPWPTPEGGYRRPGEMVPNGPLIRFKEDYPKPANTGGTWRPPVSDKPVFWREFSSQEMQMSLLLYYFVYVFLFVGMAMVLLTMEDNLSKSNLFMSNFTPLTLALLVFPIGVVSSHMIAKERQERTLDTLCTTALDSKEILQEKWQASILRMRWPFIFLMGLYVLAVSLRAIDPAAFIWLSMATVIYIAFFATLGLFVSTCCATALKATVVFSIAFLALGLGGVAHLTPMGHSPGIFWWVERVLIYALSPFSTVRELTFSPDRAIDSPGDITAALVALGIIVPATWSLWKLTVFSFERSTSGRSLLSQLPARQTPGVIGAISPLPPPD
jgi:ABC-type transport system involved in multi-copper enzyme maturation permease subunit